MTQGHNYTGTVDNIVNHCQSPHECEAHVTMNDVKDHEKVSSHLICTIRYRGQVAE